MHQVFYKAGLHIFAHRRHLRTRLTGWFLLIALLPLGWMVAIAYEIGKTVLFEQASRNLRAYNMRQEKLSDFYFQERASEAAAVIAQQNLGKALAPLAEALHRYGQGSQEYEQVRQRFEAALTPLMQRAHYENLLLLTPEGQVIFSLQDTALLGQPLSAAGAASAGWMSIFQRSAASLEVEITSLIAADRKEELHIFIAMPLWDPAQGLAGMAIIKLNTTSWYRFLSSIRDIGTLVQPLLVAEIDRRLYAITPAAADQSVTEVDPASSFGRFIRELFTQSHLVRSDVEYHHRKTLMAGWRFDKAVNWAFVTRINQRELLQPIDHFQYLFWILIVVTGVVVLLAARRVARKIADPILALTEKTRLFAAGDLSQRIEVDTPDEIGRLGQSFNHMAAQLDGLVRHLDELVAQRTREYERQNIQLEETIRQLHATQDQLITQEKLASLGALTAGIAHEIKNPLNFINNFSELSQERLTELEGWIERWVAKSDPQEQEELKALVDILKLNIGKIYTHGKRADSIVRHMLQHSRGVPGQKIKLSIHKLLDEYAALAYHGRRAQDAAFNVVMETHYDPAMPELEVIPQEMGRVFLNLLNNAFYSVQKKKQQQPPDGAYRPTVVLTTLWREEGAVIKFWDNGMGIAPPVLPKLFTPFFTTKPAGEGTGLGLSLSYNIIVQGHGGRLSAASREGEFAEFTISLPKSLCVHLESGHSELTDSKSC